MFDFEHFDALIFELSIQIVEHQRIESLRNVEIREKLWKLVAHFQQTPVHLHEFAARLQLQKTS